MLWIFKTYSWGAWRVGPGKGALSLLECGEVSLHPYTAPKHSWKVQDALEVPTTVKIMPDENKFLEQVLGMFLYYGQAVASTMLMFINIITVQKEYGIRVTMVANT